MIGEDPEKARVAAAEFGVQVQRLQTAQTTGRHGEARVAWTASYAAANAFGPDCYGRWNAALTSIGFNPSTVESRLIGALGALGGGSFEVYEDFVTCNGQALDNDRFSTMAVFQDGQVHMTATNVTDRKGRVRTLQRVHDLRTAAIQVSGPVGTLRANIHPDHAGTAQQIAAHFNARMQTLAPSAATAADLQAMVDSILNATGQPAAEKLRQLDHL